MDETFNHDYSKGEFVFWKNGTFDYYIIEGSFKDNGIQYYELRNPNGSLSGGRARKDELTPF